MPIELESEELIPGATKVSSDSSQQVGTDHSSGTMAAASESPLVTSNDLPMGGITDSSAMMSPAVTISVGNNGSVLPDAFNNGDALETYEQVSQKVSANPSVVGGCSCKTSYMGMLKCTPKLRPHQFRPSTVRWTTSKELRETTKELNAEMFDSGGLQKAKERIDSLQQELRNSTDLNLQEQFKITLIQAIQNLYVLGLGSSSFIENFGSKSMSTKLVSEELIPGAAKHFSDSPVQIGTSNSSGWLGGTIAAPSTSSQVTSNDFPVGGIMASANPSAVGGRSC